MLPRRPRWRVRVLRPVCLPYRVWVHGRAYVVYVHHLEEIFTINYSEWYHIYFFDNERLDENCWQLS